MRSVVVTGMGTVSAVAVGGAAALEAWLAAPAASGTSAIDATLPSLVDPDAARRLSRVSQLSVAASGLALRDAGLTDAGATGLVLGTELGDLRSSVAFVDGYLRGGAAALSPLLFPGTVMNAMAASVTTTYGLKGATLTLNAPTVAGDLALARAALMVASGRVDRVLAGGVDDVPPIVDEALPGAALAEGPRGEGATLLVLEALDAARARGATPMGEIVAAAWRATPSGTHRVARRADPRAIEAALAAAGLGPRDLGWVVASAGGDGVLDLWSSALLERALGAEPLPVASLTPLVGRHAGLGALRVAAATWTARTGVLAGVAPPGWGAPAGPVARRAGLVHAVGRGGGQVALIVAPPPGR